MLIVIIHVTNMSTHIETLSFAFDVVVMDIMGRIVSFDAYLYSHELTPLLCNLNLNAINKLEAGLTSWSCLHQTLW